MISNNRKKDFPIPERLQKASAELENIARNVDKKQIKDVIYKGIKTENGEKIYTVRDTLKEIYYNKCAYCEIMEHKPEIEHYRPKKEVKEDKTHQGYYWLCYEWTNLIPSCHNCNTENGKRTQFPIMGDRVNSPSFLISNQKLDKEQCKAENSPLINERPYLFHPEIDTPETAFEFKINGAIRGIDHLGRGRQTARICDLNRENLKYRRQIIIDDYKKCISESLDDYFDGTINERSFRKKLLFVFLKIRINSQPNKEFSLVSKYIESDFDQIIPPLLPTPKQRLIIINAYRRFKNNTLYELNS